MRGFRNYELTPHNRTREAFGCLCQRGCTMYGAAGGGIGDHEVRVELVEWRYGTKSMERSVAAGRVTQVTQVTHRWVRWVQDVYYVKVTVRKGTHHLRQQHRVRIKGEGNLAAYLEVALEKRLQFGCTQKTFDSQLDEWEYDKEVKGVIMVVIMKLITLHYLEMLGKRGRGGPSPYVCCKAYSKEVVDGIYLLGELAPRVSWILVL